MEKERIGILGGSFNPIHIGHLIMAQDAADAFDLHRILFVPAAIPPHKLSQTMVTPDQRMDMVRLALGEHERWEVSDVEVRRGGISYSVDTVKYIASMHPEAELYFMIGGDTLPELHTWKSIEELLKIARFVTMVRPGFDQDGLRKQALHLPEPLVEDLHARVRVGHVIGVSSTEIRMRVAQGRPISYLVPAAVERYITEHKLYSL